MRAEEVAALSLHSESAWWSFPLLKQKLGHPWIIEEEGKPCVMANLSVIHSQ